MRDPFRLLLVEDDVEWRRALREMYRGLLPRHDIKWAFASETEEAVDLLSTASRPFDLLSLDFLLERTDGRTVLRKARELDACRAVVVITGFDQMVEFEAVVEDEHERRVVTMTMQPFIQSFFPERHLFLKKDLSLPIEDNVDVFRGVLDAGRLLALIGTDRAFTREGDTWRIVFAGRETRVSHRLGFSYLAVLLSHPRKRYSCAELEEEVRPSCVLDSESADKGLASLRSGLRVESPFVDEYSLQGRSRRQIERELAEVTSQLEAGLPMSNRSADLLRARKELLEDEIATLRKQSSKAVNDRVSANLRRAVTHLAELSVLDEFVKHLRLYLTIGTSCSYLPPTDDRRWEA